MAIYGTDAADSLTGTDGNDEIEGLDGDDVIDGGAGDDTLMAGRGHNTFRFGRNDGHDAIRGSHDQNPDGTSSRFNTLEFKAEVLASDVTVSRDSSSMTLVLAIAGGTTIRVSGFFYLEDPWNAYNPLQLVRFSDGTQWDVKALVDRAMTGTAGADRLVGTRRADTLDGGAGDDELEGGDGNDTYLFGPGDGADLLARKYEDRVVYTGDESGKLNTLRFKDGVTPADVTVTRSNDHLVFTVKGKDTFSAAGFYSLDDPRSPFNPLQRAVFADGTEWNLDTLTSMGVAGGRVYGTIRGTRYVDTISGTAGDDRIDGQGGRDLINASPGHDWIDGGEGLDTVAYAGPRHAYAVSRTGPDFLVSARAGSDAVEDTDRLQHVERLQFSDGGLALDLDGQAGQVAKILGAVFGADAVADRRLAGTGLLLLAQGMSYEALAAMAVSFAGKAAHADIVDLLWNNIMGTAIPTAERAYWIGLLDSGVSVGAVTVMAADSSQNASHIDLIGLAATGLAYQ